MRVLGVDPGSRFMGFGVVEEKKGKLVHLGHGVIKVVESAPLAERLKDLHAALSAALQRYQPEAVAVEGLFTHRNARSALVLDTRAAWRCSPRRRRACPCTSTPPPA